MEDLAEFSVKIEPPVSGQFQDYTVYTCNAWCQGPVVAQALQMLEDDDLAAMGHNSTEYIHLVTQALNLTYADRHAYYGDPDLVDVPIEGLAIEGLHAVKACGRRHDGRISCNAGAGQPVAVSRRIAQRRRTCRHGRRVRRPDAGHELCVRRRPMGQRLLGHTKRSDCT